MGSRKDVFMVWQQQAVMQKLWTPARIFWKYGQTCCYKIIIEQNLNRLLTKYLKNYNLSTWLIPGGKIFVLILEFDIYGKQL